MSSNGGWEVPRPGWTCPECGFDFDGTDVGSTADAVRAFGRRYRPPLTRGMPGEDLDALLRLRPSDDTWSALEYACHVRDVMALYEDRIGRAVTAERPQVPAMGRGLLAEERAYNAQDPVQVVEELATESARVADRLATINGGTWDRVVVRDGEELTVAWMARNVVHEGNHHLLDIGRVLRTVRGR